MLSLCGELGRVTAEKVNNARHVTFWVGLGGGVPHPRTPVWLRTLSAHSFACAECVRFISGHGSHHPTYRLLVTILALTCVLVLLPSFLYPRRLTLPCPTTNLESAEITGTKGKQKEIKKVLRKKVLTNTKYGAGVSFLSPLHLNIHSLM